MRTSILLFFLLLAICSNSKASDKTSRYGDVSYWFQSSRETDNTLVDVFYVLPTCIRDWTDQNGVVQHYADVTDERQHRLMKASYVLAESIFADSCNFFAPYYRQLTFDSWMEGEQVVDERFPAAMDDVKDAFSYYIQHKNNGRPFILAGFSQGGKAVIELLKILPEDVQKRMVAAYVIGFTISEKELQTYKNIKPATGVADTGVTICYNSVASENAIPSILSGNSVCINPLNWRTDTVPAILDDTVTVHLNTDQHVLILSGLDTKYYYKPNLSKLFGEGCFHLQELSFYKEALLENVKQRIRNY